MSGVCGWYGASSGDLAAMRKTMSRFDKGVPQSADGPGFGVAAAGLPGTSCVLVKGALTLALAGHPLLRKARDARVEEIGRRVLDAYVDQGKRGITSLQGDFALALVDRSRQLLLLAVDRIGIRNIVYQACQGRLVFGPACDVVAAHSDAPSSVDPQSIYNYAYFHMVPGPRTIFRDRFRIPAGHFLIFRGGKVELTRYWQMHFEEDGPNGIDEFKPAFLSSLREGVGAFAANGRCGTFLSGGTDSSTVAGLLGEISGAPARTYAIGFAAKGYDETAYARIAAKHFNTDLHEYYVTPADVVDAIPHIAEAYDQPFGNASAVPTFYCARLAQNDGTSRLLSGDGGDELFGGNTRYAKQQQLARYDKLPSVLRKGFLEPLLLGLPAAATRMPLLRKARSYVEQASLSMPARYESYNLLERLGPANVFTPDFIKQVRPEAPLALLEEAYGDADAHSWLNRILALDLKFTLADSDLPKVTRMCELAGIDVAFPMLHESVVDLSATLPPQLKLRGTQLRYFFKEALRGFLPDAIIAKEKHGFGLPVGAWLQSYAPLKDLAVTSLQSLKTRGIVRREFIDELASSYLEAHANYYGTMIWLLMMLELWFQKHSQA